MAVERMVVGEQTFGELRHVAGRREDAVAYTQCHQQQRQTEDGIEAPDELVDGEQRGQHIVEENHRDPELGGEPPALRGHEAVEQRRRRNHKDRTHTHQQHQREGAHETAHAEAQLVAHQFGQRESLLAHADHAAEIVVHRTGEDAAQDNPQIGRRTVEDAHDGAEDGARAGNVEELDEQHAPQRQRHVVHAVLMRVAGHFGRGVWLEDALHHRSVEEVTQKEADESNGKCYHDLN